MRKIPAWIVAVTGASLVIAATLIHSIWFYNIQKELEELRTNISKAQKGVENMWASHSLADQREANADLLFGLGNILADSSNVNQLLFSQSAVNFRGAVMSMYAATDLTILSSPPTGIQKAEALLKSGDADSYTLFKREIDRLRLISRDDINARATKIADMEARRHALIARQTQLFSIYIALNLLGLIIVMVKDLPVWKH